MKHVHESWIAVLLFGGAAGCGGDIPVGIGETAFADGTAGAGSSEGSGGTTGGSGTGESTSDVTGSVSEDTGNPGGFDLGDVPDWPGGIPETCADAEASQSTVGCLFFATDLDNHPSTQTDAWGVAVANIQPFDTPSVATVTLEAKVGGVWMPVDDAMVESGELHLFLPPQFGHNPTYIGSGTALRVVSDVPITAYQFNPIAAGRATSDGSMLHPVSTWDHLYHVVGMPHVGSDNNGELYAYLSVIAAHDDTVVKVTPSVPTKAGVGVPEGQPGVPFEIVLQEGDVLQVAVANEGDALNGTTIETSEDTPVAVFSAHRCGFVPMGEAACDHLEEQLAGLHQWGKTFVAARVPARAEAGPPEPVLWQIYAAEDGTTVQFEADPAVEGLPAEPVAMDAGEVLELMVTGTTEDPGDFMVHADPPVAVLQYVTGGNAVGDGPDPGMGHGDPAAVQLAPADQFMERMVVLAAQKWEDDFLVVSRHAGVEVVLDGEPIASSAFIPVGVGDYEVARVQVEDGAHALESEMPFSVVVVGYDFYDSYAYLGGARTQMINEPAG